MESRGLAGPWGPQPTGELLLSPLGLYSCWPGAGRGGAAVRGGMGTWSAVPFLTGDAGCLGWGWTEG